MQFDEIEKTLQEIIDYVAGLPSSTLPDSHVDSLRELIVVGGEYGVAFENLCTYLDDFEVSIDHETMRTVIHLGKMLGVDPDY